MTLGEKLRKLRKLKRITQAEAAVRLGISTRSYAAYELGETVPRSLKGYAKLATLYGVPITEFYDAEKVPEVEQTKPREVIKIREATVRKVAESLEEEGWLVRKNTSTDFGDILALNPLTREAVVVELKLFLRENTKMLLGGEIYKVYGEIAALNQRDIEVNHVVVVTNNEDFVKQMMRRPPINLKFKVSARLVDVKSGKLGEWIKLVEQ